METIIEETSRYLINQVTPLVLKIKKREHLKNRTP